MMLYAIVDINNKTGRVRFAAHNGSMGRPCGYGFSRVYKGHELINIRAMVNHLFPLISWTK